MIQILDGMFPSKKSGCIKQKKITLAPEESNRPSSSKIILSLTKSKIQKAEVKKATRQIFEEANNKIKTIFPGLHIADAAKVAPEFKLEKVKTKVEKQKLKRKMYRDCKENIEIQRLETAVER